MATYNKNEMLPQRKNTLNAWGNFIIRLVNVTHENYAAPHQIEDVINES